MQANNIWAGSDYAYVYDRGNTTVSDHAQRVRVIRVFKQKENRWDERLKTFVEVTPLSDEGEPKMKDGREIVKTIRARDILQLWDDYEVERAHRLEERNAIMRKREEEAQRREWENAQILDGLERAGISRSKVSVERYGSDVRISREEVIKWITSSMQTKSTTY